MKLIPTGMTQTVGRQLLTLRKHSPKGLFVVGIGGTVVSTVLACRATLKLEKTLVDFKEEVDLINSRDAEQDDATHRKELAYVYAKNSMKLVKLYAPSVLVGAASIGALTSSHVTLNRRNTALAAAYSGLSASFESYRDRVREELGEEKELNIHHAVRMEKGADGKLVPVADPNQWSVYARFFDVGNPNWKKDAEHNRMFVQCQQNYMNHLLHARGHVFLNEVYDALGLERTKAGQVVGWVVGNGDNYIDFGMFEAVNSDFINGHERSILLDFNVDGNIFDLI